MACSTRSAVLVLLAQTLMKRSVQEFPARKDPLARKDQLGRRDRKDQWDRKGPVGLQAVKFGTLSLRRF